MGRRQLPSGRERRHRINSKRRKEIETSKVDPRAAMMAVARQRKAHEVERALADIYNKILIDVGNKYHGGGVGYAVLKTRDDRDGTKMRVEVQEALSMYQAADKTPENTAAAGGIIKDKHQAWIDSGRLFADKVNVREIPTARIYKDGRVEAMNQAQDSDALEIGIKYKEALSGFQSSQKK